MNLDYFIMVLSTDWFEPYWAAAEIDAPEPARRTIQQGCRPIVEQILGGAEEYYLTSFDERRTEETRVRFESLVREIDRSVFQIAKEWEHLTNDDWKASGLYSMLTERLLSDETEALSHSGEALSLLRQHWSHSELDAVGFTDVCGEPVSSWDRRLAALTPDQPTMLSDSLFVFIRYKRFRKFWLRASAELTEKQRDQLLAWYRDAARRDGHRDLTPSYIA
jgi:hypothetical protein